MKRKRKYNYSVGILEERWQIRYLELIKFKKKYGHTCVPQGWKENKPLAGWVRRQRVDRDKMPSYRKEKLQHIGFVWKMMESAKRIPWEAMYKRLRQYKEKHGHCNVPVKSSRFGRWVGEQRTAKKDNKLSKERTNRLNQIDFEWKLAHPVFKSWEERYRELVQFKEKHGHCLVSRNFPEYKHLANWVKVQRRNKHKISTERKNKLNRIEFTWKAKGSKVSKDARWKKEDIRWNEYFEKLKKFVRRFGHVEVPLTWKEDKSLGAWVSRQRSLKRTGQMPTHRLNQLNQIGFLWEAATIPGKNRKLKSQA